MKTIARLAVIFVIVVLGVGPFAFGERPGPERMTSGDGGGGGRGAETGRSGSERADNRGDRPDRPTRSDHPSVPIGGTEGMGYKAESAPTPKSEPKPVPERQAETPAAVADSAASENSNSGSVFDKYTPGENRGGDHNRTPGQKASTPTTGTTPQPGVTMTPTTTTLPQPSVESIAKAKQIDEQKIEAAEQSLAAVNKKLRLLESLLLPLTMTPQRAQEEATKSTVLRIMDYFGICGTCEAEREAEKRALANEIIMLERKVEKAKRDAEKLEKAKRDVEIYRAREDEARAQQLHDEWVRRALEQVRRGRNNGPVQTDRPQERRSFGGTRCLTEELNREFRHGRI